MIFSTNFAERFSSSSSSSLKILTLQHLLKRGFSPTLKTLNNLLSILLKNHRFRSVLHLFSQMSSNKIDGNSRTHSIITWALLKEKRFQDAENFIAQMEKDGFSISRKVAIWDTLIRGLCVEGKDPEKGLSLLQECMQNRSILPSYSTFCSLIYCFSSQGKMDRAIEVLETMTDDKIGYHFGNFICCSVIAGLCRTGKPELALGFYENAMKTRNFRPNIATYTAVLGAFCRQGRIKDIFYLVHNMDKEGVVSDAVFYSSWIDAHFKEGDALEAFQKHKLMVENGIKPDVVSYTILIDGFCKEGNVEKAVGFMKEMKKDGLEPNLVTYTAIMYGFCKKGKLDEAFDVFRKVQELGIRADEFMYATLIDGLCRKGDMDWVFCLLEEMESKSISAGIITYNTVINGLCKVGKTCEADEISTGIFSDNFTYSTLIHGYIKEKNMVGVLETKRRLEAAGISIDIVTCNLLIKALFMAGAFEDSYLLFKGIEEMGLVADSVTYCVMIDGYCKVGRINEALEIFDEYRRSPLVSTVASYNCIIGGLCQNGMVDMAAQVFSEIIEKGLAPDAITYATLIKGKFEKGDEDAVLDFLHGIEKIEPVTHGLICNSAISFLCKEHCSLAAFDVYMMMRKKGSVLTSECYYLILKGFIRSGKKQLVQLMLNAYLKEYGIFELRISKVLVSYLCMKDVNEALLFLDRTRERNICVSISTSVVDALAKSGRVQDAYKLILAAEENGMAVDVVTYSIVVDGLCEGGYLNIALDLCANMRMKGFHPNIVTYNSVIKGLCQQGCLVEAFRLFDSLEKNNMLPTIITYATLIGALSKEGFLEDAKELFESMLLKGFTPNTRIYNLLISGYCRLGFLDEAFKLLLDLERRSLKPDSFTVSAVIDGCWHKGDIEGALGFFTSYKGKGILPDFLGFLNLIKGLCAKGRMEEARSVLGEMLQCQSVTELINRANDEIEVEPLSSFLGVLCKQGSIQEATDILNEVGSLIFPFRMSNSRPTKLKKLYGCDGLDMGGEGLDSVGGGTHGVCLMLPTNDGSILNLESMTNPVTDDSGMEYSHLIRKSPLDDFNAYYSFVASLCSKGKLQNANRVVKEMILNIEEHR